MQANHVDTLPRFALIAGLFLLFFGFVASKGVLAQTPGAQQPTTVMPDKQQEPAPATSNQPQKVPATPGRTPTTAPLGTAVSPDLTPEGTPASSPSGAAIAPGKQKRIRRFTMRTALLIGGGVAIGIVSAASLASPSRAH